MNRKNFIRSVIPLGLGIGSLLTSRTAGAKPGSTEPVHSMIIPPYLRKGDLVGICSPAGYISMDDIRPAIVKLEEWGFRVKTGSSVGKRDFSFGGTDKERLDDLQGMLDDRQVKAVLSARGGYGSVRIVDKLDFSKFRQYPKWVIGFSDITVLHCHINRTLHVATLHSKMCNSFPESWSEADDIQRGSIDMIRDCLLGKKMDYRIDGHPLNRPGRAEGILVGGNLKSIESVIGSASDLSTHNRILFLEDTGEYLYSLDRIFRQLRRSNKLSGLKGLVIGGFKVKPDDPGEEFGRNLEQIVLDNVDGYDFPVCFNAPVGHQKNNFPLKCGVWHKLDVTQDQSRLWER